MKCKKNYEKSEILGNSVFLLKKYAFKKMLKFEKK